MGNGQSEAFRERFIDTRLLEPTAKNVWRMYSARTSAEVTKLVESDNDKLQKAEAHPPPADAQKMASDPMAPFLAVSTPIPLAQRIKLAEAYTHPKAANMPVSLLELNLDHHFIPNPKAAQQTTSPPPPSIQDKNYKSKYKPAIIAKGALEWLMMHPHYGCFPVVDVGCFGDVDIIAVSTCTNVHPATRVIHRHNASEILYGLSNIGVGRNVVRARVFTKIAL